MRPALFTPFAPLAAAALSLLGCEKSTVIGGPADGGRSDAGTGGATSPGTGVGTGGNGTGGRAGEGGARPDSMSAGGTAGIVGTGGLGATAGAAGAGGTAGTAGTNDVMPADISGRWGMFEFEDPVGVQLFEAPDGTLSGRGCAAGAPGGPQTQPAAPELFCGNISGKVSGRTAQFAFPLGSTGTPPGPYSARVTVSADGRRMTGVFTTGAGGLERPTSWLRVPENADWLMPRDRASTMDPLAGTYQLTLVAGASVGNEFVAGRTYEIRYGTPWHSLWGDLGSFWHTEMTGPANGSPLRVGPVSPTVPELPVSLALEFEGNTFTRVTASTASGGFYTFTAAKD